MTATPPDDDARPPPPPNASDADATAWSAGHRSHTHGRHPAARAAPAHGAAIRDGVDPVDVAVAAAETPPVLPADAALERRAGWLFVLLVALIVGAVAYLLYARGAFEPQQRLVLVADDSEGVQVGADVTFSGFPIGRVRRIELAEDGSARMLVDVPRKDARWLRTSSVFTMTKGIVGGTTLRAYSGMLADPPLPDGAERRLLVGDAAAELPRVLNEVRTLVANLTALTAAESALAQTLGHVQKASATLDAKLAAPRGGAELLLGADAAKLGVTLERTNQLLARLDALAKRTDGVVARADVQLLGERGLVPEATAGVRDAQASLKRLQALLDDARGNLTQVSRVLHEAEGAASNARAATADLGALRAEVDAALAKVQGLIDELNRRWPFKRDTEIKLP